MSIGFSQSMKWRMQNNIDGIIHEDIPIEKELPYTTGLDLRGHPSESTIFINYFG